ncbi:unnamed protein product (macronuclear) [Paramecium tetraurelia]|uniref:ubiquitinyl hydrolase 1 n=1 Tax=Paramecium tetraurelia TaxID=5888 RepID=A0C383_PARTE|nr:uncharacterized protein GSPATT00034728001 [Paramecium tetraurelia]CAK65250.1 unnamed protein product [Paramecium tetraurelia]|eukprot:XP_001432647.1 hypothetical protein (macronuclear) [Paramecium tetraurelia strain d4-2]
MSEDLPEKETEQPSYLLWYILILVLFLLLLFCYGKKCGQSKIQPKENEGIQLKLLEDQKIYEEQKLSIQENQSTVQMDQNRLIMSNIVKQFQKLQKQVEYQHKSCGNLLIYQTSQQIVQQSVNKIKQIYDYSSKLRAVDENQKYYIRRFQDKSELRKNYGLTLKTSAELYKNCNSFREVRGDGNCFYTAFGFQFLSILLFEYSQDQFNDFFNKIRQIELPMKIFVPNTNLKIDDKEIEKQLLDEFQRRMTKLKLIEDINQREEQFSNEFAAYEQQSEEIDGCLYGLSTIFFRNYSNYVVDFSDAKDAVYDREKLLNWEEECNSNEVVIAELAKQLNTFVQLIFIENSNNIVIREYGINKIHKIILLIKPGHYNIGYYLQDTIIDQYIQFLNQLKGINWKDYEYGNNQQNTLQEAEEKIEKLYSEIAILKQNNTLKQKDAFKIIGFQLLPLT